mmetsp:Transcript_139167/g.388282  ORF Transcript_139167/g.388282 Transcript_139167/m.388282 type:complete len:183 (-) Transcript_139167:800-1348(-)
MRVDDAPEHAVAAKVHADRRHAAHHVDRKHQRAVSVLVGEHLVEDEDHVRGEHREEERRRAQHRPSRLGAAEAARGALRSMEEPAEGQRTIALSSAQPLSGTTRVAKMARLSPSTTTAGARRIHNGRPCSQYIGMTVTPNQRMCPEVNWGHEEVVFREITVACRATHPKTTLRKIGLRCTSV